jgi:hypothetical protein
MILGAMILFATILFAMREPGFLRVTEECND